MKTSNTTLEVGSPITMQESCRLVELEAVVKAGLQTFVEVGEALLEIRDSRLYRIEHDTFEAYCGKKWKMSRIQAHRLIGASEVSKMLPIGNKPTTESQARPLSKLPADKQPEAWAKAVDAADGKQPTAKQVEAAVVELLAPEPISPEDPASTENVPSEGMVWADKAIKCLEHIQHNDSQKKRAYRSVRHWLSLRG